MKGAWTQAEGSEREDRVEALLAKLTLEEKISLLSGQDFWSLKPIDRLGIPALSVSDGPTGLRSTNSDPSTVFPVGTALAATWNVELVEQVGSAIAREAIAYGVDVLLAPGINLHRSPLGGRNFEYYSEDPLLAGSIGVAYVDGVQGEGVGTSVKHFAANNQEHRRLDGSSDVTERVLQELYLPAFEMVVREAKPWTIMSAYNAINGTFCSENDWLLNRTLKGEWGFDGVVVSDWMAAKSTAGSANGGLDLEMPGPGAFYGPKLEKAVADGEVSHETIDEHARRVLRLIDRSGIMDGNAKSARAELSSDRHRDVSREASRQSIVLLKNEGGCLPLEGAASLAVIGGAADYPAIQGGGSSQVSPDRIVTPLDALETRLGGNQTLNFERGVDHEEKPPILAGPRLSNATGELGLDARHYDNDKFEGTPVREDVDWRMAKLGFGNEGQSLEDLAFGCEWEGFFTPKYSGVHEFEITHSGPHFELTIDGQELVSDNTQRDVELLFMILELNKRPATIELEAGKAYPIKMRYSQPHEGALPGLNIVNVAVREPAPKFDAALTIAESSEVALVFVGPGTTAETEGWDRTSMALPDEQNRLVSEVAARNSKTVVIVNCGGPVEMPWIDDVEAVLQMWLPGQEGGSALVDVLMGDYNPSGKLPTSFPVRYEDNPAYLHFPGGNHVEYGEGLFVGYRYYESRGIAPLFAFGHGLSYTRFEISSLSVPDSGKAGSPMSITCNVTNTGDAKGAEVVQLYVEHIDPAETMPVRQLKAFTRCELEPGESQKVKLNLPANAFGWYDVDQKSWTTSPGKFRVHVGNASDNLPLFHEIEFEA